ncbi:MAG: amylo-alpha-1,6-glucosidase [Nanobdellota archaeon]
MTNRIRSEFESKAYDKAEKMLENCTNSFGFTAAKNKTSNGKYKRIWGRDSMICSLAALKTNNATLLKAAKKSLITLASYQHEQGEIPSNVDPFKKEVSFGGTAGRVDANLWFLIGFGQYVKKTGDLGLAKRYFPKFRKTIKLVRVHEFNHKSLIYVPMTGDWADEYIQEGYVLYDQLLYLQAFKEFRYLSELLDKDDKKKIDEKINKLKYNINVNYWLVKKNLNKSYNKIIYERALNMKKPYFFPYFNPGGYGSYFDLFANSLSIITGVASDYQENKINSFVRKKFPDSYIPAFSPVITKKSPLWNILINNYGKFFRNKPYEYHNGGIWPMVLGFYAASKKEKGRKILSAINNLNSKNDWEFNEVFNGKSIKPNGTKFQAWSAAATLLATEVCINGKKVFL